MRRILAFTAATLLSSCSPPVMFRVDSDEAIINGTLTLNGQAAALTKNLDGAWWGKWNGSDADGTIRIVYSDGAATMCRIGYVTHGMTDVQRFTIRRRQCTQEFPR